MKRLKWIIAGVLAVVFIAVAIVGIYVYRQLHKDPIKLGRTHGELAFISDRDGDWDIYMLYPDGTLANLTDESKGHNFFYSIAFSGEVINHYATETGKVDPAQVKADGSGYRTMDFKDAMLSVIKDGLVDMDPSWNPGGGQMIWLSVRDFNVEIYNANSDGSNSRRLTDSKGSDTMPAWSPDGSQIAFISDRDGEQHLYLLDIETRETTRLTSDASDYQPVWSMDGNQIMFLRNVDDGLVDGKFTLYVINRDGSGLRPLGDTEVFKGDPTYSPYGEQTAFMSNESGFWHIYTMDPDGSNVRPVTDGESNNMFPAWRPVPADQQESEPEDTAADVSSN